MCAQLAEFVRDHGVRIVGGCCGTTPEHLTAIVRHLRAVDAPKIGNRPGAAEAAETRLSSASG